MTHQLTQPKLKILHIISGDRWAGAEVQAYTLLKELNKSQDAYAIVLNEGELANRLKDLQIPVTLLDESRLNAWKIFKSIRQILKEIRPDIVHTHRQKENILGSIANLLSIRAKCVRTVHGDAEFEPTGTAKIQTMLDNFCGRYLQQAIIAVSDDLHQKLLSRFPQKKLFTVVNGIDPEEIRKHLQTPDFKQAMPNKKHIGIAGRLDPVKRIDIFLEMAKLLLQNHPEIPWHFHIFGEGKLEAEMKQLSDTLGIAEKVTFHGHRKDIKDCIYGLDAVIMCSDHEGLPMTALESIALGTPMIAHGIGGLANLLQECSERLVERHDPVYYATALNNTIRNNPAKMKFPRNHTIKLTSACMRDLYSKLR